MSKKKLYLRSEDSETCHNLDYHLKMAAAEELEEVSLFEAIPDKDPSYGWCRIFGVILYSGEDDCGKLCKEYSPCNGKSGKCRFKTHCYTWGEQKTFKVTK